MSYQIQEFKVNNNFAYLTGVNVFLDENKDTNQPSSCKSVYDAYKMNSYQSIIPRYGGLIDIRDNERTVFIPKTTTIRINSREVFMGNDVEIPYNDSLDYSYRFIMVNINNIITSTDEPYEWRTVSSQDFACITYKEVAKYINNNWLVLFNFVRQPLNVNLPYNFYLINGKNYVNDSISYLKSNNSLITMYGNGLSGVNQEYKFISNHIYKITVLNPDWNKEIENLLDTHVLFGLYLYDENDSNVSTIFSYTKKHNEIENEYIINIPEYDLKTQSIKIFVRGVEGEIIQFYIEDISENIKTDMKLIPQAYAKIFINSKNRTVTLYKNTYIHIGIKQVFLKNDSEVYFSDEADYSIRYFLINKKSIDKSIVNDYAWENTVDDFKIVNYRSELLYNGEWYIAFILSIHDSNIITSLPDEHYVIDDKTFETLKNKTEIIPRNGRYINFIHNERKVVIPKGTYIRVNKKIIFVLNEVNVFYSDSLDYSVRVLNINPEVIKNATNNSDVELTSEDFSIDSYLSFNNSSWINLFTFTLTPIKPDLPVTSYQINGASPIESLTDIVSLNGGYIELRSKLADIRKYYGIYGDKHNGNKPFNIIFTADAHNSSYCLKRIISFKNTFSEYIDDILHCGDVVSDQFADDNPLASITGGEYVLNVIGNHDNWDSKNAIEQTVNQRVPQLQVYQKFFEPYISNWNVVQPTDVSVHGYCYYYKDYSESKVRLIILDCMNWNEHQINWLETVLDDSISNTYHVIICNHYSPNAKVHGLTECGFESIYTDNSEFYIGNSIADNLADLVQTKINNGLKFICYLFGHFHLDKFGYIVKYPNQYYVCVDKTSGGDYWERDSARLYGKAVDAFDVISVDTTFEILTILRIGQNRDKFMRPKNYLTFDYKNSKLISHS